MDYLEKAASWLLDGIFPPLCLRCRSITDESPAQYLCHSCEKTLRTKHTFECISCHTPTPIGTTCLECRESTAVDSLLVVADYEEQLVQKLIKTLKYRFIPEARFPLVQLTASYLSWLHSRKHTSVFDSNPIITSVPLHPYRQRWRGFNQAELIAQDICNRYHMEYRALLERCRHGVPQALLASEEDRRRNLKETFQVIPGVPLNGRNIVIIDDVCTTGTTLGECAAILKANGAGNVTALVIARG